MACPKCGGTGFLYEASLLDGGRYCECMLVTLKLHNMEQIWRSLSKAHAPEGKSKLAKYVDQNLWVTSPLDVFRGHLKALCYEMPSSWDARVRSDADILDAWFGTAKAQGVKIFDLEVADSNIKAIDIPDLVGPPSLVILVLGVKRLPNRETPNAVLEAISYRQHDHVPTWVVDHPEHSIESADHNAYSEDLEAILQGWTHIHLTSKGRSVARISTGEPKKIVVDADPEEQGPKNILGTLNTVDTKTAKKGTRRK